MKTSLIPDALNPDIAPRQAEAFATLLLQFIPGSRLSVAEAQHILSATGLAPSTVAGILSKAVLSGILIPHKRAGGRTHPTIAYSVSPFFLYWQEHHNGN